MNQAQNNPYEAVQNAATAVSRISFKIASQENTVLNPFEKIHNVDNFNNIPINQHIIKNNPMINSIYNNNLISNQVNNPVRNNGNPCLNNFNSNIDNINNNHLNNNSLLDNINQKFNKMCISDSSSLNNNNNFLTNYKQLNSTASGIEPNTFSRSQPQIAIELPEMLSTAYSANSSSLAANRNQFGLNAVQDEDKDGKHLCWIIALSVLFCFFAGFYFYFNFSKIKRKELAVGVFLAVCFITTIGHLIYFLALSRSADLF